MSPLHSGLYLHFKSLKELFSLVGKAWCRQQKPWTIGKFSDGISFYLATMWLVGTYGTTLSANQRIVTTEPILRWFCAFSRAWQHLTAASSFFLQLYPFTGLCWPSVWLARLQNSRVFFSKSVKKSVKRGVRVLRARSARASHALSSLNWQAFSLLISTYRIFWLCASSKGRR